MRGTIASLRAGYGFIARPDAPEEDVFFHALGLDTVVFEELDEGDLVSFDYVEHRKGPRAVNVKLIAKVGSFVPGIVHEEE